MDSALVADSLERLERPNLSTVYVEAETPTEKKLVQMIEAFFGMDNIGVEDNFFELGGDSLKAMIRMKRIEKEFKSKIVLLDFFKAENIKQISDNIDEKLWLNKSSEKQFVSII